MIKITKAEVKRRVRQAYEAGGMAAAIDVFSAPGNLRLGEFDYCPACECETPSIDRECLICGQKTSNTYAVSVNVSMVNWKLLRRQKLALLRAIEDKDTSEDRKDRDLLEGLLSLLDDIQDQTAEAIGEKAVFGKLTTKTKNSGGSYDQRKKIKDNH